MNKKSYKEILETLKTNILSGRYDSCRALPSVGTLARRFGVARATVHHAVEVLVHQGLVTCKQGRGAFACVRKASRHIGLMVPGVAYSEFYAVLVGSISRLAQERDYTLLYGDVSADDLASRVKKARSFASTLVRDGVSGVIYQPLKAGDDTLRINADILSIFSSARIPVVLIDTDLVEAPQRSAYDFVSVDNINAGELVTDHVIAAGARNAYFHMRPSRISSVRDRYRGMLVAKAKAGIGVRKAWSDVLVCEPDDEAAVRRCLRRRPRPDALVCENDTDAAEIVKTLSTLGFSVPADVLVAGFDDVRIARLTSPALTTVRQPYDRMAAVAFDRLLDRIAHPDAAVVRLLLPGSLVVRESTGGS